VLVVSRNLEVRRSVSGVGSANARPDSALQRAGTQPAAAPATTPPNAGAVNSQSPAPAVGASSR
jgi:chemotaxis protein MotB